MLAGAAAIFVFVMVLLLVAYRRAPREEGEEDGALERVWVHRLGIGFPAVVLLALLAYGLVIGEAILPRTAADAVTVRGMLTFLQDGHAIRMWCDGNARSGQVRHTLDEQVSLCEHDGHFDLLQRPV